MGIRMGGLVGQQMTTGVQPLVMEIFMSQRFVRDIGGLRMGLSTMAHPQIQGECCVRLGMGTQRIQRGSEGHLQLYGRRTLSLRSMGMRMVGQ